MCLQILVGFGFVGLSFETWRIWSSNKNSVINNVLIPTYVHVRFIFSRWSGGSAYFSGPSSGDRSQRSCNLSGAWPCFFVVLVSLTWPSSGEVSLLKTSLSASSVSEFFPFVGTIILASVRTTSNLDERLRQTDKQSTFSLDCPLSENKSKSNWK